MNCEVCEKSSTNVCKGCNLAYYCSRDCQIIDWKRIHKNHCKHIETIPRPVVGRSYKSDKISYTENSEIPSNRLINVNTEKFMPLFEKEADILDKNGILIVASLLRKILDQRNFPLSNVIIIYTPGTSERIYCNHDTRIIGVLIKQLMFQENDIEIDVDSNVNIDVAISYNDEVTYSTVRCPQLPKGFSLRRMNKQLEWLSDYADDLIIGKCHLAYNFVLKTWSVHYVEDE